MITIKLTCPGWPIERQTPNQEGIWDNCRFLINQHVTKCDYWVVVEGLKKNEKAVCPRENTILITHEPPVIKQYPRHYVEQFGAVITCRRDIKHKNLFYNQPALPWHVGRRQRNHVNLSFSKDYDELMSMRSFQKDKLISVISSAKTANQGHRRRLKFVHLLKQHFGDGIDVFGRGIREIEDKWDALARYKYHVALENSAVENYWTEKLSDAYLAGCYPIYYGCPNIEHYFDSSSLTSIDMRHPEKAIGMIETCIKESMYEQSKHLIQEARNAVLNRYNLFAVICEYVNNNQREWDATEYKKIKIRKESRRSGFLSRLLKSAGR
jgi:hypothetical protein